MLMNLDGNDTAEVIVRSQSDGFVRSLKHLPRTGEVSGSMTREEYHLTAPNGNLYSQMVLLNGDKLAMDENGNIPNLLPAMVDASEPIKVAPYSIVFARIPYFDAPACG